MGGRVLCPGSSSNLAPRQTAHSAILEGPLLVRQIVVHSLRMQRLNAAGTTAFYNSSNISALLHADARVLVFTALHPPPFG